MLLSVLTSFAAAFLSRVVADLWSQHQANTDAKSVGREEAVNDAQTAALDAIRTARKAEIDAEAAHQADATDAAFDQDFRRP